MRLGYPLVIGELSMGDLRPRGAVLRSLGQLPRAAIARDNEVLGFIELQSLHSKGLGYIDAHLLASVALTDNAQLWTRDRRLNEVAQRLGVAFT